MRFRIAQTDVSIVEGDVARSTTEAVVNAANSHSFTWTDGGVSGALRNANAPDDVVGKEKQLWDSDGEPLAPSTFVPPHCAGAQPAGGRMAANGVKFIKIEEHVV